MAHISTRSDKEVITTSDVLPCVYPRFGKPFRKLVLRVLRLGRSGEEEQLDLSGLLRVGGGVKGECRPFTEEEVEEWVLSLRGIVEVGEGRERARRTVCTVNGDGRGGEETQWKSASVIGLFVGNFSSPS